MFQKEDGFGKILDQHMNKTYNEYAQTLAQYIYDTDVQHIDYSDHCDRGNDPSEHILWSAAGVLGLIDTEGFHDEFKTWENKQDTKKRRTGTW